MNTSYESGAEYYDLIMEKVYQKNPKKIFDFIQFILSKKSLIKIDKILDFGCGTGIDSLFFSKNMYSVTGYDVSEKMLKLAQKKVSNDEYKLKFTNDLNAEKYDCIFSYGAFGHILSNENIKNTLNTIYNSLNPGGVFILHQENILGIIKYIKNRKHIFKDNGFKYKVKLDYKVDLLKSYLIETQKIKILKGSKVINFIQENHIFRNWTYPEGMFFLENSGFKNIECYSSLNDRIELSGNEIGLIYCCIKEKLSNN
ncbi:class I SAM-dependent methyltransferase [Treponema zuelzerae]|uniref:Class I SAM-dependent methyltransferase n=1 Tax=Teretinema zuelzerae TaxID=156 RepID=A0AAE3JMQ8_9SPIR|nr:class I SAM-dependent methyltransferase [Teretinema zuelzerae]MCD1655949.1 class I SAM-dependent methyltransferase [Teretinema zuelzerae]